jgi:hypothetical protein
MKQSEGEKTEITPEAELLAKLKTKEAESVDLKVSITPLLLHASSCAYFPPESATVPTSRLSELAA